MSVHLSFPIAGAARSLAIVALLAAAGATMISMAGSAQATTDAGTPGVLYGDPVAAAPYWQPQTLDDCGLMAVADVVGQLSGRAPSERSIIAVAKNTPSRSHPGSIYIPPANPADPNTGNGTDPVDEVVLLERYGIHAAYTDQQNAGSTGVATGMAALERYLGAGHAVIVGVNSSILWNQAGDTSGSDHAVVVTGVDTASGTVHLNDSGIDTGRDEQIGFATFTRAWSAGAQGMVVTLETVP